MTTSNSIEDVKAGASNGDTDVHMDGDEVEIGGEESVDVDLGSDTDDETESSDDVIKEHVYHVGDLVWVKVKRRRWWPGQIQDPNDASEFSLKHGRKEGRFLVTFFGDGYWSWCLPSQLAPFVEDFNQMSGSTSENFVNAVEEAVDVVSRSLDSDMTCKCKVSAERRDGLFRPEVYSEGVKAGVLVPHLDMGRLPVPRYEPSDVIKRLRNFAATLSFGNSLELGLVRGWVSAFYRSKGYDQLPVYQESSTIEGLEDTSSDKGKRPMFNNSNNLIRISLGPKEDVLSSRSSSPPNPSQFVFRRRSVSDIMAENESDDNVSPKRHQRSSDSDVENSLTPGKKKKKDVTDVEKDEIQGGSSSGKASRVRKSKDSVSPALAGDSGSNDTKSGGKLEVVTDEGGKDEGGGLTPRERKKSKYLSPPYTEQPSRVGRSSFKNESESSKKEKSDREGDCSKKDSETIPKSGDMASAKEMSGDQVKQDEAHVDTGVLMNCDMDIPLSSLLSPNKKKSAEKPAKGHVRKKAKSSNERNPQAVKADGMLKSSSKTPKADKSHGNLVKSKLKKPAESSQAAPGADMSKETSDKPKSKKYAESSRATPSMDKSKEKPSSALILAFNPEFPLPSKEDVVKVYRKFGKLNKTETNVCADSHSAIVAYKKVAIAEVAFKSSISESPFGVNSVGNYWLGHSLAGSSTRGTLPETLLTPPPHKGRLGQPEASNKARDDDAVSEMKAIRTKLEITGTILENYHVKFADDDKESLKAEMKDLMERVEAAAERIRVVAEKHKVYP